MTRRRVDNVGYAQADAPMKRWEKPAVRRISFSNDVAVMAILSLIFAALAGAGYQYHWIWMLAAGSIALAGLWIAYFIYLVRTTTVAVETIEYQDVTGTIEEEPVAVDPGRVTIPSPDGRSVEFMQPHAAEFAAWAGGVIREMRDTNIAFRDKRQLSQNTAVKRGWPKEMYKSMLASLRAVGWVTLGQNNTPVLTQHGAACIDAWLRGKTPPALSA